MVRNSTSFFTVDNFPLLYNIMQNSKIALWKANFITKIWDFYIKPQYPLLTLTWSWPPSPLLTLVNISETPPSPLSVNVIYTRPLILIANGDAMAFFIQKFMLFWGPFWLQHSKIKAQSIWSYLYSHIFIELLLRNEDCRGWLSQRPPFACVV